MSSNIQQAGEGKFGAGKFSNRSFKPMSAGAQPQATQAREPQAEGQPDLSALDAYRGKPKEEEVKEVEEAPKQQSGTVEELYQQKYGTSASEELAAAQTAAQGGDGGAAANAFYEKVRGAVDQEGYWEEQDLGALMTNAGHKNNVVNIGNYVEDGGKQVDASLTGGINFDSVKDHVTEKGWEKEYGNSVGQLGSAMLKHEVEGNEDVSNEPHVQSETPDQITEANATIKNFNDNYSNIWSDNPAAQNNKNKNFMDDYSFSAKQSQSAAKEQPTFASAKDRAASFQNQQSKGVGGMP